MNYPRTIVNTPSVPTHTVKHSVTLFRIAPCYIYVKAMPFIFMNEFITMGTL